MQLLIRLLFVLPVCTLAADLQQLYRVSDWFALRDAIASDPAATDFFKGAVAATFNDAKRAEKHLRKHGTVESRLLLVGVYMRQSRSRKALEELRAAEALKPGREDVASAGKFFSSMAYWPDQKTVRGKPARIRYEMHEGNAFVPIRVNGREFNWIFDTGANWSMVSESEAKLAGMEIRDSSAQMGDATGRSVGFRVAYARDVEFGGVRLRHVTFTVMGDDREPFRNLPPGRQGVIGMPVMLPAGSASWTASGDMELGMHKLAGPPNLFFENAMPLVRAEFRGRGLMMQLDTGAQRTHFWPKFAADFPVPGALKESISVGGVGNRVEVESMRVPELPLHIGGRDVMLRNVTVLLKQEGAGAERYYANVGMDLLTKGTRTTVDFRRMRLELE